MPRTYSKYDDKAWLGTTFNYLTVIGFEHSGKRWVWKCQCVCGRETICSPYKVICGKTKSCGCKKKERCQEMSKEYRVKHGGRKERLYSIWHCMKQRCNDLNSKDYKHWGGRGISVCKEWEDNYLSFRNWAIANGYREDLTIDRVDVDGDYCPENCRWVDIKQQARNKRNNRIIDIDGVARPLSEWCEIYGKKYGTVYARIMRYGWDAKEALQN